MLKEIAERQSIRKFTKQEVEKEKIEDLLKAAMRAPTARNTQSWRFMVVTNREALDSMTDLQPYTSMMKTAACAILVMGDTSVTSPREYEYIYVDAAAAVENILLEAVHIGLGACWCAIGPNPERIQNFRQYYGVDERYIPVAAIAIGYPDEQKEIQDRYDPAKVTWYR